MKKLLVFVEKPGLLAHLHKIIIQFWDDYEIKYINLHPYVNPKFVYPKGLKYKDYPLLKPITTKNNLNILTNKKVVSNEFGEKLLENYIIEDSDLNNADEILYTCDPDYSAAISFKLFIDNHFGDKPRPVINAIKLFALDTESVIESFHNKQLFSELFKDEVIYGEVRRYFDYNWNLNSLVIINNRYQEILNRECAWISKYGLQLLYFIKDNQLSEGKLITKMCKWIGTGKYQYSIKLGSEASFATIIYNLIEAGLVESEDKIIKITKDGELFLNNIHKDSKDADLPFRLNEWSKQGLEIVKPKIDRYIKTFFGKL